MLQQTELTVKADCFTCMMNMLMLNVCYMFTIALKYDLENPTDIPLRRVGNENIFAITYSSS